MKDKLAPRDVMNSTQRTCLAVRQIVDDSDIVPSVEQFDHCMSANVAGSTGHQDAHPLPPFVPRRQSVAP